MNATSIRRILLFAALSTLGAPLPSIAQTTVFHDAFTGGDTLNPTTAVLTTATTTAYEIASGKNATATTLTAGALDLNIGSTTSGFVEAQAQFTNSPITLSTPGQYIEVYQTFTDPANFFNGIDGNNTGLSVGLFNSGGTPLTDGTNLWNGNLSSAATATSEITGDAQDWVGYAGNVQYSGSTAMEVSTVQARVAQTGTDNLNQALGDESGAGVLSAIGVSDSSTSLFFPALTQANQYTVALQITYVSSTTDEFTESLLAGSGTSGAVIFSYGGENTGSTITDTFDSLEVGYRSTFNTGASQSLPIDAITVVTGTAAVVPEPSTYGLVVLATLGALFLRRRVRRLAWTVFGPI